MPHKLKSELLSAQSGPAISRERTVRPSMVQGSMVRVSGPVWTGTLWKGNDFSISSFFKTLFPKLDIALLSFSLWHFFESLHFFFLGSLSCSSSFSSSASLWDVVCFLHSVSTVKSQGRQTRRQVWSWPFDWFRSLGCRELGWLGDEFLNEGLAEGCLPWTLSVCRWVTSCKCWNVGAWSWGDRNGTGWFLERKSEDG